MKSTLYNIKVLLLLITVMLAACDVEEFPLMEESAQTGRIVLSVPEIQIFTEGETRGEGDNVVNGNIADYTYTLNDEDGNLIQEVFFDESGAAIIPAGTYRLTATTNTTTPDAGPWYQGYVDFTLQKGQIKPISIDLGYPQNVEIDVTFAKSFTDLYENYSVTIETNIGTPTGTKTITTNGKYYAMPDSEGKVSYTIKGTAGLGSHVIDIPAEGIRGTISVEAGTSYPLNITAEITEHLIEFGGTHSGEFDTKEYRPLN